MSINNNMETLIGKLAENEFYTEGNVGEVVIATSIGGNDRVKSISFYDNGIEKRTFRVASELFKNKAQAKKYFKI